jgi:DMSO/TMAO reductase YedYZ molybdopterin-dependent catalytic subunit
MVEVNQIRGASRPFSGNRNMALTFAAARRSRRPIRGAAEMGIRVAELSDIPEMHRVRSSVRENTLPDYSVLTPEKYRAHLQDVGRGWVYEHDGRVVGCAIVNRVEASIWALFVEPRFEGRGFGRALHDTMLGWLRSQGAERVTLGTEPGTRAARFYEAAGWQFRELDADGEAIYELELTGGGGAPGRRASVVMPAALVGELPPGQFEIEEFPRFGLGKFAFRFPKDAGTLEMAIRGDVGTELVVREEIGDLPRVDQVSDFHCVTTWSRRGLSWSGFRFRDFYEAIVAPRAAPLPGADLVVLRSQDGYRQSLPLEDLLAPDVLLADQLGGRPLSIANGAPIRLVAPAHYGYKSLKHIRAVELWRDAREYRFPGPRFMDHPRARVALEERGRGVSPRLLRRIYPLLVPPIRWLFRVTLERHERRTAGR